MNTFLAVLLLISTAGTLVYWISFFLGGTVHVVEEDWYIRFERSFPVADLFMISMSTVAAIGLLTDSSLGTAFGLVAAGAHGFLGLMDVTFSVENGLYRLLPRSREMWAEVVIEVWTLAVAVLLLVVLIPRV